MAGTSREETSQILGIFLFDLLFKVTEVKVCYKHRPSIMVAHFVTAIATVTKLGTYVALGDISFKDQIVAPYDS